MAPIDNIVYKTFVKKFNDQYNGKLLEGQEKLLSKYIASFHDNGIELKIFLNEELYRIKGVLNTALATDEISKDDTLRENTNKILRIVDSYKTVELTPEKIQEILKIQSLVEELEG
jgi:TRAP-type mannitol/chloroaromatic compound transport system substrate-binding protein